MKVAWETSIQMHLCRKKKRRYAIAKTKFYPEQISQISDKSLQPVVMQVLWMNITKSRKKVILKGKGEGMQPAANIPKGPVVPCAHPLHTEGTENENSCCDSLLQETGLSKAWPCRCDGNPKHGFGIILIDCFSSAHDKFCYFGSKCLSDSVWREKLKSSIDFLPATKVNVLQTSIPAWCTLWAFRERWSTRKGGSSPSELMPVPTHTLVRNLQQHSPLFNSDKGQSHT